MVLSVVVKFGMLSLQSDLMWSDRTHARMVHGSSCSAFVAQILGVVFRPMLEI